MITTEAFTIAYQNNYPTTIGFLRSRGVKGHSAEELAQDAWGKGWIRRHSLRNPDAVVPWVNSIALNLFRSNVKREPVSNEAPEPVVQPRVAASIDAKTVLRRCKSGERQMLEAMKRGYSSSEIATQLSCTPSAVRVRLYRLKRRLKRQLGSAV